LCIKKGADLEADNLRGDTALLLAAQGCVSMRRAPSLAPRAASFSSHLASSPRASPRCLVRSEAFPRTPPLTTVCGLLLLLPSLWLLLLFDGGGRRVVHASTRRADRKTEASV